MASATRGAAATLSSRLRNWQGIPFLRAATHATANVVGWTSIFVFLLDRVGSLASVEGRSMQPTLNPDESRLQRDLLLLDKYSATKRKWRRGDVVTLRTPLDANHVAAKRIIALEDDWVVPDPRSKFVQRNGLRSGQSLRIPKGHCWVEGDAGLHSRDSQEYGPVPLALLTARVAAVVWPPARIGWVETDPMCPRSRTSVVTREAIRSGSSIL
ncbi:hypothetical protein AMAG_02269 [Allomyces macrogynus ATCC 38327]|uniref:Mitochondrial inner membrane protease subunit 2 n=1 Tax=Allomyces macrogynus (strain ATCC 38327) TaxID=578462 RepID=A0A0L0S251_ALLM3|nr:hypothetical protein AMAG_02269 [Allomyces macrogynus ATCC 38327]|eukprot:KNE56465.1 hypothetical protein AMAG_02269 [Allomyces macrogynus ATCC 38327]